MLAAGCLPVTPYTTSGVVEVGQRTVGGYVVRSFEDRTYTCGRSGYQTFALAAPVGVPDTTRRPLWVKLHGGGVGAFDLNRPGFSGGLVLPAPAGVGSGCDGSGRSRIRSG